MDTAAQKIIDNQRRTLAPATAAKAVALQHPLAQLNEKN
jgi:hypothetical protein